MKAQPRRRGRPPARRIVKAVITDAPPVLPAAPAAAEPEAPPAPEWRDLRTEPPFNPQDRRPHGPFDLLVNGQPERASWRAYLTDSGGRAWAWHLRNGQRLAFAAPGGWRQPAEA